MKIKCPECGTENNKDETSCKSCGANLKDALEKDENSEEIINDNIENLQKPTLKSSANHDSEKFLETPEETKTNEDIAEDTLNAFIREPTSNSNFINREDEKNPSLQEKIEGKYDDYIIVDHSQDEIFEDNYYLEETIPSETEDLEADNGYIYVEHTPEEPENLEPDNGYIYVEHTPEEPEDQYIPIEHTQEQTENLEPEDQYIPIEHTQEQTENNDNLEEIITKEIENLEPEDQYIPIEHTQEQTENNDNLEEIITKGIENLDHINAETILGYPSGQESMYDYDREEVNDDETYDDYSSEKKSLKKYKEKTKIQKVKKKISIGLFNGKLFNDDIDNDDNKIDKNSFRYVHKNAILFLSVLLLVAIAGTVTIQYIDENSLNYLSVSNTEPGEYTNNVISFKLPSTWEKYNTTDQNVIGSFKSKEDKHKVLLSVYQSKASGRKLSEIKGATEELDIRSGALVKKATTQKINNVKVYDVTSKEGTDNYEYRTIGFIKDNKEYAFLFISDDIDSFNKDITQLKRSLTFY